MGHEVFTILEDFGRCGYGGAISEEENRLLYLEKNRERCPILHR
jgi:hypothetical protein